MRTGLRHMEDYIHISRDDNEMLQVEITGPMFAVMQFEIFLLEIIHETYFKMKYNYNELRASAEARLNTKIDDFKNGKYDSI